MKRNIPDIINAFDGKLIGNDNIKQYVCRTLLLMEDTIISYITEYCWFFGSTNDSLAYTFTGNDLLNMHFIYVSDALFVQNEQLIMYTIAHEIGHVMLKHRNSVFEKQSKTEIRRQEKEADAFARKYVFTKYRIPAPREDGRRHQIVRR